MLRILKYRLGLNNKNNENNFGIKRKLSDSINIDNKILGIITIEDVIEKIIQI